MWMLEELGLEYERIPTDHRAGEHHAPAYAALNPNLRVPTLVDGDLVLWESIAINLYLAGRYDGGLWPRGEAGRGVAYQWSLWGVTELELLLAACTGRPAYQKLDKLRGPYPLAYTTAPKRAVTN